MRRFSDRLDLELVRVLAGDGPTLDDKLGRTGHVLRCQNDSLPLVRDVEQVRLDDIDVRQQHVEGRNEHFADGVRAQPDVDRRVQGSDYALMSEVG